MDKRDTILIADDMEVARAILSELFSDKYNIEEAQDGRVALNIIDRMGDRIALVLTDIVMPNMDGFGLLREMRARNLLEHIPVIVTTSLDEPEHEIRAFELGAVDAVIKPFSPSVVRKRVGNILEQYGNRAQLEQMLVRQTNQLQESSALLVDTLSSIIEHRNTESASHVQCIKLFTRILLEAVSSTYPEYNLPYSAIDSITMAAGLHDIGKITISDAILNKPGKLVPEEFELIKSHTINGSEIIGQMLNIEEQEYLQYAYNICRYHHERWDGRGYPEGLKGDAIPLCAQVVGLADVYDALTSERVYKAAFSHEVAVEMILDGQCGMFSPKLIKCFTDVLDKLKAASGEYSHEEEQKDVQHVDEADFIPRRSYFDLYYSRLITAFKALGATVIELDFNLNEFEMIYSSYNDFSAVLPGGDSNGVAREFIKNYFHPDDADLAMYQFESCTEKLLSDEIFKSEHEYRILTDNDDQYSWFNVSMTHVDMHSPSERRAFILFKRIGDIESLNTRMADDARRISLLKSNLRQPLKLRVQELSPLTEAEIFAGSTEYAKAFHEIIWEFDLCANSFRMFEPANEMAPYSGTDADTMYSYLIKHVHSDDTAIMLEHIAHMREGTSQPEIAYRKYDPSGEYSWYRETATPIRDCDGRIIKYFGKTQNIDKLKADSFHASLRDHRDALTGVLDKDAILDMVSDTIKRSSRNARHALMLIDVDYLEQINASHGHVIGDGILKAMAEKLLLLFSNGDYTGRVGGDEFVAFVSNAVSVSHIESMAQRLTNIFKQLPSSDGLELSTSIGVAIYPQDGITYDELLRHATSAMYAAKYSGRGCWQRYSELSDRKIPVAAENRVISHIDSEQYYSKNFLNLMVSIFSEADDELEFICRMYDSTARRYNYNNLFALQTQRECHIISQWSDVKGRNVEKTLVDLADTLVEIYDLGARNRGIVIIPDTEKLPEEHANKFREAQIRAIAYSHIDMDMSPSGLFGFICRDDIHLFTEEEGFICRVLAKLTGMIYGKQNSAQKLLRLKNLTSALFTRLDECCYVINEEFEIIIANSSMRTTLPLDAPKVLEGKKCYRAIHGCSKPCEHCPVLQIDKSGEPVSSEIYSSVCGRSIKVTAMPIVQPEDARQSFLLTVNDVDE